MSLGRPPTHALFYTSHSNTTADIERRATTEKRGKIVNRFACQKCYVKRVSD